VTGLSGGAAASASGYGGLPAGPRVVMFAFETVLDRRIIQEAESLTAVGYEVRIATPAALWTVPPGGTAVAPSVDPNADWSDAAPPRVRVHRMMHGALRRLGRLGLDPAALKGVARRLIGPVWYYHLPLFAEAIRTLQAEIYIGHDLPMLPVALAAASRHGGRVVYDAHELWSEQEMPRADRAYWARIESRHIARADAVFTVNTSIADILAERHGIAAPRVLRNCDRRHPPCAAGGVLHARLGLPPATPLAVFQGRLEPAGHLTVLLAAWRELADLPHHLVLIGDGSQLAQLEALAATQGLAGRVHLHPRVPQAALPQLTAGAAFGLIPYQPTCLNTFYCSPNKLFEYIAAEVPVVATDLPEIRRIVQGFDVGAVGPTATAAELAALIRRFVDGPGLDDRLPARLAAAAEELDWAREAREFVAVISELGATGGATRTCGGGPSLAGSGRPNRNGATGGRVNGRFDE